jgi:ankyrin repeat protein
LILSRQNLPILDQERYASAEGLRKGAYILSDVEGTPDASGQTALIRAVGEGRTDVVKLLVLSGADVNRATNSGITPLMEAATAGRERPPREGST